MECPLADDQRTIHRAVWNFRMIAMKVRPVSLMSDSAISQGIIRILRATLSLRADDNTARSISSDTNGYALGSATDAGAMLALNLASQPRVRPECQLGGAE